MTTWTLGINAPPLGTHDAAACLVGPDGAVVALVEEERPLQLKHAMSQYPRRAIRQCLEIAGISGSDVDLVAVGWDLPRHWARTDFALLDPPLPGKLWNFDSTHEFLTDVLGWAVPRGGGPDLVFVPHHRAHAASAIHASGFEDAAVLVVDGEGDDESISIYEARRGRPLVRRALWPRLASLGLMYEGATEALGLSALESGKTMGLAAYGVRAGLEPWPMLEFAGDQFQAPFAASPVAGYAEVKAGWRRHIEALGYSRRAGGSHDLPSDQNAVRLAYSAQRSVEQVMDRLAGLARRLTGLTRLCVVGGVGLNCSTNGRLAGPVYVPPVAHDAGVALGAAWSCHPPARTGTALSPYLGRDVDAREVDSLISLEHRDRGEDVSPDRIADLLGRRLIGGVFTGRAEVGPRALCHRSIIAMANTAGARDRVNRRKGRELWRPLGPVTVRGNENRYWPHDEYLHRYMLGAAQVTAEGRRTSPAIVHADGSARPQIVSPDELVGQVLCCLRAAGEAPVLINTSFNERGRPMVDGASDAYGCATNLGLDFLVLGHRLLLLSDAARR